MSLIQGIPIESLHVGDYCRIFIKCGKGSKMGRVPRNGKIVDINRSIITIEDYRLKRRFVGMKDDLIKTWRFEESASA